MNLTGNIVRDGYKLGYKIEGEGPTVLVVGSSVYYPRVFSPALKEKVRLVHIDHRGFAPRTTGPSERVLSLDVLLDDIEACRAQLQLEDVVILGHSGHAFLALEYAKKFPRHISHVALLAVGPSYSKLHSDMANRYFEESLDPVRHAEFAKQMALLPADLEREPERRFAHFNRRFACRGAYDPHFDAAPFWEGVHLNMPLIDQMWGEFFRDVDIKKGLEALKKPVYIGMGLFDYLVPPHFAWAEYRPLFHDLHFRIFTRSGHNPQLEEAVLFDEDFLKWIHRERH